MVDVDGLENSNTLNSITQTLLGFDGGGNGRIYGKGMNVARQILRRFNWATEARTHSAAACSITATLSVVPAPLVTTGVWTLSAADYSITATILVVPDPLKVV